MAEVRRSLQAFNAAADSTRGFIAAQSGLGADVGVTLGRLNEAADAVARLAEFVTADPSAHQLEVDLVTCEVRAGTRIKKFELESEAREMLLEGLDGIDLTLKHRADIDAFVTRDRLERPWIYSTVEKPRA